MLKKILEKPLQFIADFICIRIKNARSTHEVNYWVSLGLWIDFWCTDHNIWLE